MGLSVIVPVIRSGGEGRRLWPMSSSAKPKQFLRLTGEETLLQQTVRRLHDPALFDAPIIIGGARPALPDRRAAARLATRRIVLEPVARNTAPARCRRSRPIRRR
jgi:mannose-1-phosphate guanylyltransferase